MNEKREDMSALYIYIKRIYKTCCAHILNLKKQK